MMRSLLFILRNTQMNLVWGATSETPFAQSLEVSCRRAVHMLVHSARSASDAQVDMCMALDAFVAAVERVMEHAAQKSQTAEMLEALRYAFSPFSGDPNVAPSVSQEVRAWGVLWGRIVASSNSVVCTPQHDASRRSSPLKNCSFGGTPTRDTSFITDASDDTRPWIALCVAIRHVAVGSLREMVGLHAQLQYCQRYWGWAVDSPRHGLFHQLASGYASSWRSLWRGFGVSQYLRDTVHRVNELRQMETFIVSRIGRVHHAVESLTRSIEELVRTPLVEGADIQAAELRQQLTATVVRVTRHLALSSYERCGREEHGLSFSPTQNVILSSTIGGDSMAAAAIPRVESVAFGDPIHGDAAGEANAADVCEMLRVVHVASSQWTTSWSRALAQHMAPPLGRHWRRTALMAAIVWPLVHAAATMTMADVRRSAEAVWSVADYVLRWYIVGPALNLHQSLFAPRQGVVERRDALLRDTESLAKIIKDYHKDYYDEPSAAWLEEIRQNAIGGDYGLIHRHLEEAIRHPIKGFLFGNLVRLTLIHVQQLKLDVSRVLTSFDEVLETNDVNFRMMALGPFFLVIMGVVSYAMLHEKKKLRPAFVKMRLHWRHLHRLITFSSDSDSTAQDAEAAGNRDTFCRNFLVSTRGTTAQSLLSDEEQGRVVLTVHRMRCLTEFLPKYPLIREFLEDLSDVEGTRSTRHQRLRTLERMMVVHHFLSAHSY